MFIAACVSRISSHPTNVWMTTADVLSTATQYRWRGEHDGINSRYITKCRSRTDYRHTYCLSWALAIVSNTVLIYRSRPKVTRCPQQAAHTENFRVFRLASLRYNWLCVFLENDNIYEVETSFCLSKATKRTRIALKIMFLSLILYTRTSSATNPVYLLLSNSCMALSEWHISA